MIRYRTGDLVRPVWQHEGPNRFVLLDGGIVGRVDDMLVIRGVNIFPSSIDQILRSFPEVVEYRTIVRKAGGHGPPGGRSRRPAGRARPGSPKNCGCGWG